MKGDFRDMNRLIPLTLLALLPLAGCQRPDGPPPRAGDGQAGPAVSLAEARKGFRTKLVRRESAREPVPEPPRRVFRTVRYDAPAGKLAAYLTPDPGDGKTHPAIVW